MATREKPRWIVSLANPLRLQVVPGAAEIEVIKFAGCVDPDPDENGGESPAFFTITPDALLGVAGGSWIDLTLAGATVTPIRIPSRSVAAFQQALLRR